MMRAARTAVLAAITRTARKALLVAMTRISRKAALVSVLAILTALLASACAAPQESGGTEAPEQPEAAGISELPAAAEIPEQSAAGPQEQPVLAEFAPADMSGYAAFRNYDGEFCFVDMTVEDILSKMKAGESFAFIATFSTCPWCNMVLPALNAAALERDMQVGCLDTRKDPSWTSNLDITDYDRFAETFADYLELDGENRIHLYTPHVFFIREGEVVREHQGALPEIRDSLAVLTERQESRLEYIFGEGLDSLE